MDDALCSLVCEGTPGHPGAFVYWMITVYSMPAEKAEAWGLIWKMHEDLELMGEAHKLCQHFASAPTIALALIKRALDESWANDLDAQLDLERELQREASLTPDYAEGVRAFMEKRSPAFTGRRQSASGE